MALIMHRDGREPVELTRRPDDRGYSAVREPDGAVIAVRVETRSDGSWWQISPRSVAVPRPLTEADEAWLERARKWGVW